MPSTAHLNPWPEVGWTKRPLSPLGLWYVNPAQPIYRVGLCWLFGPPQFRNIYIYIWLDQHSSTYIVFLVQQLIIQLDLSLSWAFGVKWSPSGNTLAYVGQKTFFYGVVYFGWQKARLPSASYILLCLLFTFILVCII